MNKKGFAVSVILYSVIFLIITTLFMILGLMRTRFNVNSELRDNIIENINEEVGVGLLFPSNEKCKIDVNTSDYTDNLVLTINVSQQNYYGSDTNGKFYSWDNEVYTTNNKIKVNRSGKYIGYFKDNVGGSGSCEIEILSKMRYSSRACKDLYIVYSDWYIDSNENKESCTPIAKEDAENYNSDTYIICTSIASGYQVKTYKRNPIGCATGDEAWDNWSSWSDTFIESSAIKQTRSETFYRKKT